MSIDVRAGSPADHRALADAVSKALLFPPRDDEGWAQSAPSWAESSSFGAWDGDLCVGTVSQFVVDTTVPGGARLPTGAVSRVGVLPTHRRRGIATALMHRLIDDAAERGLALMSLRASEAVIYERYGFGLAGEYQSAVITADRARPVRGATPGGSFRYLDRDEVLATVTPIYDRSMHRRAGTITRMPSWWRRYFEHAIKQGTSSYVVVHTGPDGDDGYVHYDVAWNTEPGGHGGKGEIHEVVAVDDATELALWALVLDMDLVRTWRCEERPVDDLLRWAIRDRRAYEVDEVDDEQWVRVVDVDRALAARTYADVPGAVSIEVCDPRRAANDGVWRIDAGGAERSDTAAPGLRADVSGLSAAYLGGTSWRTLVATGRAEAVDPAAVEVADALFGVRPLPFCGSFF